jgi:uncharacterized protein YbjT (DUF2867 family)
MTSTQQRQNRVAMTSCDYFGGHELARHLLQGHRKELEGCNIVCTGVHLDRMKDLERQGAEIAQLKVDDIKQMQEVFRNCDWVVLVPIPESNRVQTTRNIMEAIKKANVKHVILVSRAGADSSEKLSHLYQFAEIEQEFKNYGFNWNCVIRNEFAQNWFHAWSYPVEDKGQFPLSIGQDRKFAPIRIEDVSCAVKDILRGDSSGSTPKLVGSNKHNKQTYTLTGPETVTGNKIVDELNRAVNGSVSYNDVDRKQMEQVLRSVRDRENQRQQARGEDEDQHRFEGQPTEVQIQTILDYFDVVRAGHVDRTTEDLRKITGREGHRVESFFRDHADEFRPRRQ